MLCERCREQRDTHQLSPSEPGGARGWRSAAEGGCERCGGALGPDPATEALLAKLTQLARFGLAAEHRPLLEPAKDLD